MARNVVVKWAANAAWINMNNHLYAKMAIRTSAVNECAFPAEDVAINVSLCDAITNDPLFGGGRLYNGYFQPGLPIGSICDLTFADEIAPPIEWIEPLPHDSSRARWKPGYPLRAAKVRCEQIFNPNGHEGSYDSQPDDPFCWANAHTEDYYFHPDTYVLDRFYNPRIDAFEIARYDADLGQPSDDGDRIRITLRGSVDAPTDLFSLRLHYASGANVTADDPYIDLTQYIPDMLSADGIADSAAIITTAFDAAHDWSFLLVYGDAYESAQARDDISKNWANVHLSGLPTGGVRFGGFCARSAPDHPAFECDYPIYADGGIEGVTNFSMDEVKTGGKWIDGKQIYQKVLRIIPAASKTWYLLGAISNLDTVINVGGMWRLSDGLSFMQLMHYDSYNGTVSWPVIDGNGEVYINFKGSYSPTEIFAIVTYTKTTD